LHPHRHLAIASLILTAVFAAPVAHAAAKDSRPEPPAISIPSDPPSSVTVSSADLPPVAFPEPLPDAPSTALQQDSQSQQPAPQQPAGPLSAQEQLKIQERQRVFGVMAAFNTTTSRDALPLSPAQKFQLFFKSQTDPWPFALASVVAGINQASDAFPAYGQGVQGYAKYYGAAYGDAFIGNLFGNAILTSWWHEDPRYFQKGTGNFASRFLWASTSTVWCRRDNGTWGPNYANVAGNLIGAAIANVYYPASERTVGDTVMRGFTVTAEGIVGSEIIEFWPDMVRHYKRKQAEKLARKEAQQDAQTPEGAGVQPSPAPSASDPKP
jgi:hypothetical protein